jgi:PAS domain-containing protein
MMLFVHGSINEGNGTGQDHYTIWGISREEYENSDYVCVDTDAEVIKAGKTCIFDEKVMGADGLRKLKTYKTPIFEEDGQIIGTIGIARDVTEASEYERTVHDLAYRDYLTSLV